VIRWTSWHRWTAICLLAYIYLAVAVALQRQEDGSSGLDPLAPAGGVVNLGEREERGRGDRA
jgi:hypothetical protein